jgi:hypothetical protein
VAAPALLATYGGLVWIFGMTDEDRDLFAAGRRRFRRGWARRRQPDLRGTT